MWFKRKRKSDPDSALTETLRSLQTLLDDDDPGTLRIPPTLQSPRSGAPRLSEETRNPAPPQVAHGAPAETPDDDEASRVEVKRLVVEDYDFDLFEQMEKQRGAADPALTRTDPSDAGADDADGTQETPDLSGLEAIEFHGYDTDSLEYLPERDGIDQVIDKPAVDSIPVLTDIVYQPPAVRTTAEATEARETEAVRKAKIIDTYVAGLTQRLEHDGLATLDAAQQQRLREALASILKAKATDPAS